MGVTCTRHFPGQSPSMWVVSTLSQPPHHHQQGFKSTVSLSLKEGQGTGCTLEGCHGL